MTQGIFEFSPGPLAFSGSTGQKDVLKLDLRKVCWPFQVGGHSAGCGRCSCVGRIEQEEVSGN